MRSCKATSIYDVQCHNYYNKHSIILLGGRLQISVNKMYSTVSVVFIKLNTIVTFSVKNDQIIDKEKTENALVWYCKLIAYNYCTNFIFT